MHKLHLLEVLAEFTVSIWHKEVDGLDEQVLAVEGSPPQVPQLAGQAGRAGAALSGQVMGAASLVTEQAGVGTDFRLNLTRLPTSNTGYLGF